MTETNSSLLCSANDSCLVIVDIQTKLTAAMPAKVLARLQRNTGLLIHSANKLGVPVYVTEQYPSGLGNLEPDIQKLLAADTKVFEKTSFSCAGVKEFTEDLEASNKKQVVITGMEAHICVLQSALDLVQRNYSVFVVADAVCSRHRESYETALQRMRVSGVTICDAESIVFEWLADASNSEFKNIQSLIR